MASHVRTTIRYDGPALAGHEMDVQDLAPALLALAEIVKIANRKFNGHHADIRVMVNADIEQRCFQLDVSLVQSVIERAKGFFADDGIATAKEIAEWIGMIGSGGFTLFQLIKWLAKRPKADGTRFDVVTDGGVTTLIAGDGNTVSVNHHVYLMASDPTVIEQAKKVIKPLEQPGYETLSFVEGERIVETIAKEDAQLAAQLPNAVLEPAHEDVSTIRGHVRIKSAQYEGQAKWSVMWGGRAIDVTMEPDFVRGFQNNEIDAPPNTVLDVEMEQRIVLDENGKAVGSPTFLVVTIHSVTLPPKRAQQLDMLKGDDR